MKKQTKLNLNIVKTMSHIAVCTTLVAGNLMLVAPQPSNAKSCSSCKHMAAGASRTYCLRDCTKKTTPKKPKKKDKKTIQSDKS